MYKKREIYPNVEYSLDDGKTWNVLKNNLVVSFWKKGDKALLIGYNPDGFCVFEGEPSYTAFHMQGKIAASGSVMSLIDSIGESKTIPSKYCFYALFNKCTSLTQAPELPATTLTEDCYFGMFEDCTSLTQAHELPATTLANSCYAYMFSGCTSLTQAPKLPATTLTDECYNGMFTYCTSLTQAPELPATTLAEYCYNEMFGYCTSLTQAPELPAMDLANFCYKNMFSICTSLTQAPELPAKTLAILCYEGMFSNCKNLQKIKVGFDIWLDGTFAWLDCVAPTGTFYCPKGLPIEYGTSRIPEGWNVKYIDDGADVTEHVSDASFKAWGADGKITYIGATMPVEIYDINGRLVKKMNEKSQSVDVPQHGIYVVKSGNVSLKVEL